AEERIETVINSIIDNTSESSIKALEDTYNIPYHHLEALGIKNKMSVSEIKHRFMDEEFEKEDEAYRPDFLKEENDDSIIPEFMGGKSEENKGALRGTAVHRVMELLPFEDDSLVNADASKVRKAIAEMTQTGLIGEEDAKLVNPEKVALLLQNDFVEILNIAAKEGRLHKEQPFVMSIMPHEAGIDSDSDEEILVQGIIDLFVEDEDGLILLDYKTDRVNTPDELIKRYAKQMELYGIALSKAYGKPVKNYRIYSFALTKIIDL
ncbi:MAG: PD-(D/E)XK nuclease family protein, partial [Lachnospiraceae bacterium]|nr:PD-(D/E)XK nuclease family protein [Lachnospiraceae bacterium]